MPSYIELHTASAFSFLQGASLPEALVDRAAELGYPALALLDRDGVYGAPRFHKAARAAGIKPIIGAELTIDRFRRIHNSQFTIHNSWYLPVLCESQDGYRNLCRLVTRMKLRAPKGEGALTFEDLEGSTRGLVALVGRAALDGQRYGVGGLLDRTRAAVRPRVACSSSSSVISGATKTRTTRRSPIWPRPFGSRSSRPAASGSRRRPSGRSSTCSPASITTPIWRARDESWRRTRSAI